MPLSQNNENVSLTHAKVWSDWDPKPVNVRLYRLTKCRQLFGYAGTDRAEIMTINMSTYTITSNFSNVYEQIATVYVIFLRFP